MRRIPAHLLLAACLSETHVQDHVVLVAPHCLGHPVQTCAVHFGRRGDCVIATVPAPHHLVEKCPALRVAKERRVVQQRRQSLGYAHLRRGRGRRRGSRSARAFAVEQSAGPARIVVFCDTPFDRFVPNVLTERATCRIAPCVVGVFDDDRPHVEPRLEESKQRKRRRRGRQRATQVLGRGILDWRLIVLRHDERLDPVHGAAQLHEILIAERA
jgi:hypothetical protein